MTAGVSQASNYPTSCVFALNSRGYRHTYINLYIGIVYFYIYIYQAVGHGLDHQDNPCEYLIERHPLGAWIGDNRSAWHVAEVQSVKTSVGPMFFQVAWPVEGGAILITFVFERCVLAACPWWACVRAAAGLDKAARSRGKHFCRCRAD